MAGIKQYVIVRDLPGVGAFSQEQLGGAASTSNDAIAKVDGVKWLHSYVVADRTYCIYEAPNEEAVQKHSELSGFPANVVEEVKTTISPATAASCPKPPQP